VGEFQSVPPGRYTLTVDASSGTSTKSNSPPSFNGTVEVYRASASWANFWLLAGFLILWPIVAWSRASSFETRRWSESDYSGGSSSSSSDDD